MIKKSNKIRELEKSEGSEKSGAKLPSSSPELGSFGLRLKEIIGSQSVRSFASECNLSDGVLRQYLLGKSEPGLEALLSIAYKSNVSLEWLATGVGDKGKNPFRDELVKAGNKRKYISEIVKNFNIVMDSLNHINSYNDYFIDDNDYEFISFINKYCEKHKQNSQISLVDLKDFGRIVFKINDLIRGWFRNDSLILKRSGKLKSDHPFYWLVELCDRKINLPTEYPLVETIKNGNLAGTSEDQYVKVPRYEVAASAGGGAVIHSEQIVDHLSFKAEWVRNALGVSPSSLALINVKGDSMEPTLSNGDVILIDISINNLDDNAVYVLRLNGTLLVKRVKRNFDGSVMVSSDNTIYTPDVIPVDLVESLNIVGRVVWCGRRM